MDFLTYLADFQIFKLGCRMTKKSRNPVPILFYFFKASTHLSWSRVLLEKPVFTKLIVTHLVKE
jgi:hypothetical protein